MGKRCGRRPESDYHRIWECDANENLPACIDTDRLKWMAKTFHASRPSLWLRGLAPESWFGVEPAPLDPAVYVARMLKSDGAYMGEKNIGGGDASGGKHSDTPKLRRIGWAFAILKIDPLEECQYQFDWGKLGQASGAQTINRGETWALLMFLVEATRLGCACAKYTTDSQ